MSTIIDFNNLSDPNNIKAGDRLKLPQPDGLIYEVQSGDTIDGIAKLFFAPVSDFYRRITSTQFADKPGTANLRSYDSNKYVSIRSTHHPV